MTTRTPDPSFTRPHKPCSAQKFLFATGLFCLAAAVWAAPFAKNFQFTQPDGTVLTLWGEGDEFRAVFETAMGYTVVFDPQRKAYFYAARAGDGRSLVATGVPAHHAPPPGLAQHIRVDRDAAAAAARARQVKWDGDVALSKRWARLKSLNLGTPSPTEDGGPLPAPPQSPTTGTKVGLTLLIDFPDAQETIPRSEIDAFLNGDAYTGFGNNGSVKKYFSDVSAGRLIYQNVVTIYVRMTQPKSYYDNTAIDCGIQGRLLINDALTILKGLPNYSSEILPTFNNLTTDGSGNVLAFNVFFAGADSGVWAYGLWPHSWVLASPVPLGNGKSVYFYQLTNIGTSLELGTFCHENGHMLCDFPDIYDYDYDSVGGAGVFCLMNSGGFGTNPKQVCAYLKLAAGWATVTDIDSTTDMIGTLFAAPTPGYDHFFRYRKPAISTEYFLMENRQKVGRDASLPTAGIAVWHIDELGNRDDQRLTPNSSHRNYEVTLVQADGLWDFQYNRNEGDTTDLYYLGNAATAYQNRLDDSSNPNAHWWDGTASGMNLTAFSGPGLTMSFAIGSGGSLAASVLAAEPPLTPGTENTIYWTGAGSAPSGSPMVGPIAVNQAPGTGVISNPPDGRTDGVIVLTVDPLPDPGTGGGDPPLPAEGYSGWDWSGSLGIPDTGAEVGINCSPPGGVPTGAYVTRVQVHHEITHSRITDIECRLYNSTHNWLLRDNVNRPGSETVEELSLFDGDMPVQNWNYRVRDNVTTGQSTGTLTRMQLWVYYEAPSGSDLRASSASWASGAVTEGAPFWVQAGILNAGTSAAGASHVQLYLSTDNDYDPSDDYYVGEQPVNALGAGGTQTVQWDFNMPNLGSGNYSVWVVLVVDNRGEVAELDENNTFKSTSVFSGGDPIEYYAECAADSGFTSPVSSGWIQPLEHTFSNLTPGQTYWYRVKKRWATQESAWSNVEFSQQEPLHISGVVNYYFGGKKVPGVTVALVGDSSQNVTTGSDGSYSADLTYGWSGTATPGKTSDTPTANGVDSFDQLMVQFHTLGVMELDSPYKLLAADVDGSRGVDSADQFLMQWLILGYTTQFPAGLWLFVPADYVFADPDNPWSAPANRSYENVVSMLPGQDFTAMKLGDLDGSWAPPGGGLGIVPGIESPVVARAESSVGIRVEAQNALPGQRVKAIVKSRGFQELTSMQFTLAWDPAVLHYAGCSPKELRGLSSGNLRAFAEGKLLCAWFDPGAAGVTVPDGTSILEIEFDVVGPAGNSAALTVLDAPAVRQASLGLTKVALGADSAVVHVLATDSVSVGRVECQDGAFRLSVETLPGRRYVLEFTEELPTTQWTGLPPVEGNGSTQVLTDPAATRTHRYYRVLVD